MPQTSIPAGSSTAVKLYSRALFARVVQASTWMNNMCGPAPKQSDAESKLKGQTTADMPIVRVTDLSKTAGDTISVDCFDTINGKPLMGDVNAEGRGEALSSSSMDVGIGLSTKVVDAGAKMGQQRTLHDLRGLARAQLAGYFPRLQTQTALVHLAGARGSMVGRDWVVPLASDTDFASIMINPVRAPSFNRHLVIDGSTLVQGGAQLGSIDSTDIWTLDHIDGLSLLLDDMETPIQPVKIADDPAAEDEPIKGVLWLTPRQWNQIKTASGGSNNWRTFLANAFQRKTYGSKHPLFSGEAGMWNGILIRQMPRFTIRFAAGESTQIITAANRYSATESAQAVNAGLTAGFGVERALLLGAQALATVYGKNKTSDYHFSWLERKYNFERALEVAADSMGGMAKLRFSFKDGAGNIEPTDNGVIVIDSAVRL